MKFAIIGAGRMGLRHIAVAKSLGFEIVGVCDPSDAATESALNKHELGADVAFKSVPEMLSSVKPEALVVASTAPSHCKYVCDGAAARIRFILCEKPMAASLQECNRMIEACRESGTVLGVNHQMRYMEQYTRVKQFAQSSEFGGLQSMTVAASNIGFSMNGSHYFEAFRFLTDEKVIAVSAWLDKARLANPRGVQYEDRSGQLRGISSTGKRLYMEMGADLGHGLQVVYGCRNGQIFSDQLSGTLRLSRRQKQYAELPTAQYGMPADEETITIPPADVIVSTRLLWQDLLSNGQFPDGSCGRYTVSGVIAANISGEMDGAPVRLDSVSQDRVFAWA